METNETNEIYKVLKEKFGFTEFRPGQFEVVRDVISRKDTIAILPTGIGKSLCFQLPAYMSSGTVLIISPLVSLMEDQVAIMKRNGEKHVVALNSFLTFKEKNRIIKNLCAYKFIFISPEMLLQKNVMSELEKMPLSLLVVDEAHCISQWGFDFRPDYLRIGEFLKQIKRPTILALTATANDKVINDIKEYLNLNHSVVHKYSLDRPNISFSIVQMESQNEKTKWILERLQQSSGSGVIYVSSRKRAENLANLLSSKGLSITSYHAGMEQVDRAFVQAQFINGEVKWICATNAFGMGIHKDDIRQIIHEQFPTTIAGYIQEIGRAGRDGNLSAATLLFSPEDERKSRFIVQEDLPTQEEVKHYSNLLTDGVSNEIVSEMAGISETKQRVVEYYLERMTVENTIIRLKEISLEKEVKLQQMLQIVHSNICIREEVLSFFDEQVITRPTNCCSNCGITSLDWLLNDEDHHSERKPMEWTERLRLLLGEHR
ncbi:RecQ family ATP-dependent DNA helicase [Sporosarcina sp. FA9]|uniref:RecQ family ATP-dependent DNA helicase n=1 Tax=Sporosarcina sp. FA9 TaxID=3413030 RepID=UPI003F659663